MCLHLYEGMLRIREARKRKLQPWIRVTGSYEPPDEVLESQLNFFGRTGSTLDWGDMAPVTVKLNFYCEEVKLMASRTRREFVAVELHFTQSTPKKSQHSSTSQLQKKQHFFCRFLKMMGIIVSLHSSDTNCLAVWTMGIMTYFLSLFGRIQIIVKKEYCLSKRISSFRHSMRCN